MTNNQDNTVRHVGNAALLTLTAAAIITQLDWLQTVLAAVTVLGSLGAGLVFAIGPTGFAKGVALRIAKGKPVPYPDAWCRLESRVTDAGLLLMLAFAGWWWLFAAWLLQTLACEVLFTGHDLYREAVARYEKRAAE